MSVAVLKYLNRMGPRGLFGPPFQNILRMTSSDGCSSKPQESEPCPQKASEPCAPPPPPPSPATVCPQPPPCPPMPQTMPCGPIVDPNNPCNYCPPPCIDPNYPDLTRLKKFQCLFQEDDDIPIYLKRGNIDAFFYQVTLVLVFVSLGYGVAMCFKIMK